MRTDTGLLSSRVLLIPSASEFKARRAVIFFCFCILLFSALIVLLAVWEFCTQAAKSRNGPRRTDGSAKCLALDGARLMIAENINVDMFLFVFPAS